MAQGADVIVVGAGPAGSTAAKLLADSGYQVMLLDRAAFPRHKTCASWINRLAVERFPYLLPHLATLVEAPFHGITFFDPEIKRAGRFWQLRPSGYLSLRARFDDGLRRIAVSAGAEFLGLASVTHVIENEDSVTARLADGRQFSARVLVGADGVASRVALASGIRRAWGARDYAICANADVPLGPVRIRSCYGNQFPLFVYLQYDGVQGYGWVFPKERHVCIGIGALLADNRDIRPLFARVVESLRLHGHLPHALTLDSVQAHTYYDMDPVGAVHSLPSLTRGRVMLIGDAAGFVSGATGEGIYPGMVSAELEARVVKRALDNGDVPGVLAGFDPEWRRELGAYVRRLPGGDQKGKTEGRLDLIFRSRLVARVAGRVFLYGEQPSLGTVARSLWPD
jgi:geranylgeranyl reductase family protein